jgi:DNA-binding MarR family transcriptional regulator
VNAVGGGRPADLPMNAARLVLALQHEMFGRVAEEGFDDVRPRQGAILAYLTPEGRRPSEFAELSGQHKQIIGTIADELEESGYITREPDPSDGRAKLLVPTERGMAELSASRAIVADIERRVSEELGEDGFALLMEYLRRATAAIRASDAGDRRRPGP